MRRRLSLKNAALLCAVLAAPVLFFLATALFIPRLPDELYTLGPAMELAGLREYSDMYQYPPFLYLFYALFFKAASFFTAVGLGLALRIGRLVNIALYVASALLLYRTARRYLEGPWALLCVLLFCYCPIIILAGTVVKSESLSILLLLLGIECCLAIAEKRAGRGAHTAAGALTGLLFLVKYNPCLAAPYAVALLLAHSRELPSRQKAREALFSALRDRKLLWYLLALGLTALVVMAAGTVPGPKDVAILKGKAYLAPFPSAFRATDSWNLLYGSMTYPLFILMPAFIGLACYTLGWLGAFSRTVPRALLYCLGAFSLAYFLFFTGVTLVRLPWNYGVLVPFFCFCAVFFIRYAWKRITSRRLLPLKAGALALVLASTLYQSATFPVILWESHEFLIALHRFGIDRDEVAYLTDMECTRDAGINPRHLKRDLLDKMPDYFYLIDQYRASFCKYADDPDFMRQCVFFNELLAGQTPYRLLWRNDVWFPYRSLFRLDPGFCFNGYLFERRDKKSRATDMGPQPG